MKTIKKMLIKRALKKNAREIEGAVKRVYKDASKDLSKRMDRIKMPTIRVTISR